MGQFEHLRHKAPTGLNRERGLLIVCSPMRSHVNLSRIVRMASCSGMSKIIAAGNAKVDAKIARDGAEQVEIVKRRSLGPSLTKLKQQGYTLVGLEQTTNSQNLHEYEFPYKTALVIGSEREGIADDVLAMLDATIEIPVYGMPHSYNAATSAIIAIYEYCRQFPEG